MRRLRETFQSEFLRLDEKFQALTTRERAVVGIGAVAVLVLFFDNVLIQPAEAEIKRAEQLSRSIRQEIESLEEKRETLDRVELSPDEIAWRQRRQVLEGALESVNRDIASEVSELVPPEDVVSVLEAMLRSSDGLELVRVASETPHRVGSGALDEAEPSVLDATTSLYRHGMHVELVGDFASTVEYLERVERARWHLLWDRLEYEVIAYPHARITIDLHTLSEVEEWIGV
ncbi:MAG: type II secretion system protein M [bacterium]|nr:type II secretion system protein M [bacterium]